MNSESLTASEGRRRPVHSSLTHPVWWVRRGMWGLLTLAATLATGPAESSPEAMSDSVSAAAHAYTLRRRGAELADPSASNATGGERQAESSGRGPVVEGTARVHGLPTNTNRLRFEFGARTDLTNESYYEDTFVDTTFLERRRMSTPEVRHAGVVSARWEGKPVRGSSTLQLHSEASLGDLLRRVYLGGAWKTRPADDWTLVFRPTGEYRRDRTLDRQLEEWRAALGARARYALLQGSSTMEFGVRGDVLRSRGATSGFIPDRNGIELSTTFHHLTLMGQEWNLGYRGNARYFPDSTEREHIEHLVDGRWRSGGGGDLAAGLDGFVARRATFRTAGDSRDNYWNAEGGLEARLFPESALPLWMRVAGEAFRYDTEDSTLYFDYQVLRGHLGLRWERSARWTLSVGPRVTSLSASLNPGEDYLEIAGAIEAEYFGNGSWWSASPAIGWRRYDDIPAAGAGTPALHSSYAFYDLSVVFDQPLAPRWKARVLGTVRWEDHEESAQDAGSIYLTTELRWIP